MTKTSVADVKARLSEYLDRALAGERIVICRHNTPIVELRAVEGARVEPRPVGALPGRPAFEVPSSFFEPLPDDELDAWEGLSAAALSGRASATAPRVAEERTAHSRRKKRITRRRR